MSAQAAVSAAADRLVADLRAAGVAIEDCTVSVRSELRESTSLLRMSVELRGRAAGGRDAAVAPVKVTGQVGDVTCDSAATTPQAADILTRMADADAQADIGKPKSLVVQPPSAPDRETSKDPEAPADSAASGVPASAFQPPNPAAYLKGPLTADERIIVQNMLDKGATGKEIGHRLNRDPRQLGGIIGAMRKPSRKVALAPAAPKAAASPAQNLDPAASCPEPAAETPAKPVRAAVPPSGKAPDTTTPVRLRDLQQRLDALDGLDGWNAQRDLALIGSLFLGEGLDAAIAASGAGSRAEARARFDALCPDKTIAAQTELFTELKRRAEDGQEGAA